MEAKGWMMLRALLNRYHRGSEEALLRYLPAEAATEVRQVVLDSPDLSCVTVLPETRIAQIHYSWLALAFKQMSKELQTLVLAALPKSQAAGLQDLFSLPSPLTELPVLGRRYVLNLVLERLGENKHLPLSFLPSSELNKLLDLTKAQLVELIDFLGVKDLAEELRRIVDRKTLTRMLQGLSAKKQEYLKQCLQTVDRLKTSPLNLDRWDGNLRKLNTLLHQRGLMRLSTALAGQHQEMIWHLSQKLDIGRGRILLKICPSTPLPHITEVLATQLLDLMTFLQPKATDES